MLPMFLDLTSLKQAYAEGLSPLDLVEEVLARIDACDDPAIFITKTPADALRAAARELIARAPSANSLPLWGVPFAVKDNIDVAGFPTTAACPAFTYHPERDATVIARLKAAGTRPDPAVSVPSAKLARPDATATAEPDDDPPDT